MEEARAVAELCLRLSPRDARSWISLLHLTQIGYLTRDYEAAARTGQRALDTKPASVMPHRWLAAALGQLGRQTEAADVMRRATGMVTVGGIWPGSPISMKREQIRPSNMKSAQPICHASSTRSRSKGIETSTIPHFAVVATTTAGVVGSWSVRAICVKGAVSSNTAPLATNRKVGMCG